MDHASFFLADVPRGSDIQPEPTRLWRPPGFVGAGASTELSPHHSRNQRECPWSHNIKDMHSSQRGTRPQTLQGEYFGAKIAHVSNHKSLSRNQIFSHSIDP